MLSFALSLLLAPPENPVVVGKTKGWIVLPAEVVCGGTVERTIWRPDGSQLLTFRRPTPPDVRSGERMPTEVVVWNARTRTATTIYRAPNASVVPMDAAWAADGTVLLTLIEASKSSAEPIYRLAAVKPGGLRTIITGSPVVALTGPKGQIAVSVRRENERWATSFLGATGLSEPVVGAPGAQPFTWSKDGRLFAFDSRPETRSRYVLAVGGTEWKPTKDKFEYYETPSPAEITVVTSRQEGTVTIGVETDPKEKLEATDPRRPVIVTREGKDANLAPDGRGIAFVTTGALVVRPMAELSLAEARKAKEAEAISEALTASKMAALGLILTAADMDDVLPSNAQGWQDKVMPYVKDAKVLGGFTYVFRGGDLTKVGKPSETVLGYTEGPGGRAVAYVDGSVKWVPKT